MWAMQFAIANRRDADVRKVPDSVYSSYARSSFPASISNRVTTHAYTSGSCSLFKLRGRKERTGVSFSGSFFGRPPRRSLPCTGVHEERPSTF